MDLCSHCGSVIEIEKYAGETPKQMIENKACFDCNFYIELSKKQEEGRSLITSKFEHYMDGGNVQDSVLQAALGHGGTVFKIEKTSGEVLSTNNLWFQGEIPEHLHYLFTPNFKFVK
jgi:hypothetical protein